MSMAFKIASFCFALSAAVLFISGTGVNAACEGFAGSGIFIDPNGDGRCNDAIQWDVMGGMYIWEDIMPKTEGIQSVNTISDYFKDAVVLLLGGIFMIILMLINFITTVYGISIKIGFPPVIATFLQAVAMWSYYATLAEWKSGRQIRSMY